MAVLLARICGGICSALGGVFFLYQFLADLQKGSNLIFLLLSLFLVGVAVFLLFTGARLAEQAVSGTEVGSVKNPQPAQDSQGFQQMLDRNNAITSEWSKTQKTRDEIKLLEVQANAEKGA